jgi:hypothetical protein
MYAPHGYWRVPLMIDSVTPFVCGRLHPQNSRTSAKQICVNFLLPHAHWQLMVGRKLALRLLGIALPCFLGRRTGNWVAISMQHKLTHVHTNRTQTRLDKITHDWFGRIFYPLFICPGNSTFEISGWVELNVLRILFVFQFTAVANMDVNCQSRDDDSCPLVWWLVIALLVQILAREAVH